MLRRNELKAEVRDVLQERRVYYWTEEETAEIIVERILKLLQKEVTDE